MNVQIDPRLRPSPVFEAGLAQFTVDGIRFKVVHEDPTGRTDESAVALAKPWAFVESELQALSGLNVRRMLEIGVKEGGSAVLWALLLPVERYVGVDIRPLEIAFPSDVRNHPRWRAIRLYGNTSQDDREAIERIFDNEFDGPLDLIIDDASHQYELTRKAFEICFPKLRKGGIYLIEDWAWAQNDGPWSSATHPWHDRPSLANLVLRLVLLAASHRDIISRMEVRRQFVTVVRGPGRIGDTFDVEQAANGRRRLTETI